MLNLRFIPFFRLHASVSGSGHLEVLLFNHLKELLCAQSQLLFGLGFSHLTSSDVLSGICEVSVVSIVSESELGLGVRNVDFRRLLPILKPICRVGLERRFQIVW
jgi:hypothetical protein